MLPSFQDKDYLITDKISYIFSEPKKGDVIIINLKEEEKLLIKRVIGLPGDTLYFEAPREENNFKSAFYINGELQKEAFIKETMNIPQDVKYELNNDEYFAMGDNRNNSADSRHYHPFKKEDIQGKVVLEIEDKFQFHTKPDAYLIVFSLVVAAFFIYLFFPFLARRKRP